MKKEASSTLEHGEYRPARGRYSLGDFDGYHAAPVLLFGAETRKSVVRAQDKRAWRMVDAAYGESVRCGAKPATALYIARSVLGRMHQREGLNSINYILRTHKFPQPQLVPHASRLEVWNAARLTRMGRGEPIQNNMSRLAFGMLNVELANITVFGNFRRQDEEAMWPAVSELTGTDARPHAYQARDLEIQSFDRNPFDPLNQHIGAMRFELRRTIAELEDGAIVKARTTAIVNTSPSSGFDQSIVEKIRSLDDKRESLERVAQMPEVRRAVAWMIDSSATEGLVFARNETVYAVSPVLDAQQVEKHYDMLVA